MIDSQVIATLSREDVACDVDGRFVDRRERSFGRHGQKSEWPSPGRFARANKIVFDIVVAALLLLILMPVMLVIALLVSRDGGPILFAHERIGRGGKRFRCMKFRSMVMNPDPVLQGYFRENPDAETEWTRYQKLSNDPRITAIGRVLRATSMDELPQLLNVMRLDMSLVGPRPIVASEMIRYGGRLGDYLRVRPGLTGLWQISGRSNTTYSRRVALDSWYVRNWRFWRDCAILVITIRIVAGRRGAR